MFWEMSEHIVISFDLESLALSLCLFDGSVSHRVSYNRKRCCSRNLNFRLDVLFRPILRRRRPIFQRRVPALLAWFPPLPFLAQGLSWRGRAWQVEWLSGEQLSPITCQEAPLSTTYIAAFDF